MKPALFALPLFLATFSVAMAEQPRACHGKPLPSNIEGVAFAVDGDTLAFVGRPYVRLWGIQAPELRDKASQQESRAGMRSRVALDELLSKDRAQTQCMPTKWDRYCRLVALCTASGIDLSLALLTRGMAYGAWLDDTVPSQPNLGTTYADAEAAARRDRRGLWKDWLDD